MLDNLLFLQQSNLTYKIVNHHLEDPHYPKTSYSNSKFSNNNSNLRKNEGKSSNNRQRALPLLLAVVREMRMHSQEVDRAPIYKDLLAILV